MKNIIVGFITLATFGLIAYLASTGTTFQGGAAGKVIQDIKTAKEATTTSMPIASTQDKKDKGSVKLKALEDEAGNTANFKVSKMYKVSCASCHGTNGKGIIGPDISGKTSEYIYTKLTDYKTGKLVNPVMNDLVSNLSDQKLKELADEVGQFKQIH